MNDKSSPTSRRRFLRMVGGFTAGMAMASPVLAKAAATVSRERTLAFHNLHTGEKLETTFCIGHQFLPDSLRSVNHLLRDHRTGEACEMSPELLVLLDDLQQLLGNRRTLQVISGYRSPATNKLLRQNSDGVAKKSLHMQGKAIDIRLPGTELKQLHRGAVALKRGGVGLYSQSGFVHLDVGRVRYWGA